MDDNSAPSIPEPSPHAAEVLALYEALVDEQWKRRPQLSRVCLAVRRRLKKIRLGDVVGGIAGGDASTAEAIVRFEERGVPIGREIFEHYVDAIGVEWEVVDYLIRCARIEREAQVHDPYGRHFWLSHNLGPMVGYGSRVPPEIATVEEALAFASRVATQGRGGVTLHTPRTSYQFNVEGDVVSEHSRRCYSHAPFGGLLREPQNDRWFTAGKMPFEGIE